MFADDPILISLVFGLGIVGLVIFGVAFARGAFDAIRDQADVLFEPEDLRLFRPWETPRQLSERRAAHGVLIPPAPGEWGGSR
jgi:hypothetical protein